MVCQYFFFCELAKLLKAQYEKPKITKTAKDTIMAVVVLLVITLVCIVLLSVANEYLKYVPKLDEKTSTKINVLIPSGVDDDTAFSDGYFKLYSDVELLEKGFDLNKFNKEKRTKQKAYRPYEGG